MGCDHVIIYFPDEARHCASRIEWHDPAGVLKLSATTNTSRSVWELDEANSVGMEPGAWERKLYETDFDLKVLGQNNEPKSDSRLLKLDCRIRYDSGPPKEEAAMGRKHA